MTYEYLTLSAGGIITISQISCLQTLIKNKIIDYKKIKALYCCSAGCISGLIFLLNINDDLIDNYILNRPWYKLVNNISYLDYINIYYKNGLLDTSFIINIIKPLLCYKNININITLKEFYELTKKDYYLLATNINNTTNVYFNHKTHPNLEVYKAIYMSCSLPGLFIPEKYDNIFYLDGALISGSTIKYCLDNEKCSKDKILCMINDKYNINLNTPYCIKNNITNINENLNIYNTTIIEFYSILIKKLLRLILNDNVDITNFHTINLGCGPIDYNYIFYVLSNQEEINFLYNFGKNQAEYFINKIDNSNLLIDNSNLLIDNSNLLI